MNKSDISASGLNKEMAALAKEAMSQIKGLELTEDQMDHLSAVMSAKLSADLEFRKKKRDEVSQEIVDEEQSYWAYLPDLVLEIIFQMLPYKVTF